MAIYLEKYNAFCGTGERNAAGQDLKEFLEVYNPKKYDCPSNTVDMAVFRLKPARQLLLIRRGNHPNIGFWALPGGFVELKENLKNAAARELFEETGVTGVPLVQVGTWGNYDRDPRWRVITTLYAAVIDEPLKAEAGDDAAAALWFDISLVQTRNVEGDLCLKLTLENGENHLTLKAEAVCREKHVHGLVDSEYELTKSELLAADHPLMIMDAYRKLWPEA